MALGWSLSWGLALGLVCFTLVGLRRGLSLRALVRMAGEGARTSLVVLRILVLIGFLTALWRASGTIAFFVHTGLEWMHPSAFYLAAFLLASALSMAFGSSFGVAGTAGVILAAIARSGGASLAVTGGAVLSGAYLGERLSPASSSAALTAALAGVEQHDFQLRMWRTTPLPLALSLVFYGGISLLHPIQQVDQTILRALEEGFDLSWTVVLPAVILLVLPFFKVSAARSILVSCGAAAVLAVWEQGRPLAEVAWSCVAGYVVEQPELTGILSGGGLLSMVNGMCIVLLSCASSGILNGAELLEPVKARLERMARRTGLYVTTAAVSVASTALLCNQSIALVLTGQMMGESFRRSGKDGLLLSQTLGNTAIVLAAVVPWSIAGSVPLEAMGASALAIPFSFFLFAAPVCDWLCHRKQFQME
jgi:NhaC family Na+:H+ antiporter